MTDNPSWFQTWDRPGYLEWAREAPEGYALIIARQEPDGWLCVRATLVMGERGLPELEAEEERRVETRDEALDLLGRWQGGTGTV